MTIASGSTGWLRSNRFKRGQSRVMVPPLLHTTPSGKRMYLWSAVDDEGEAGGRLNESGRICPLPCYTPGGP